MKNNLLILVLALTLGGVHAQKTDNLAKLNVQIGLLNPFYVSLPYTAYTVNPIAYRLQLGANFYKGELFASVAHSNFRSNSVPDFSSTLLTLGYVAGIPLYKSLSLKPSLAFGNNNIRFQNPADVPALRSESELVLEAAVYADVKLHKELHALLGVRAQRTLLYHNFDVINAGFAISWYFNTPKPLKKFLD